MNANEPETPITERSEAGDGEKGAPAVADLESELANLRLLIRRQDELVERLLRERGGADTAPSETKEGAPAAKGAGRSTRRGLLTQLAAGAAGVAAAAVYGTAKAGTASADFYGTVVGPSSTNAGIFAYPPGVTPITNVQTLNIAGVWGQRDSGAPNPNHDAGVIGISNAYDGVVGKSTFGTGVIGESNSGAGVYAESSSGVGVYALSGTQNAVYGASSTSYGVRGASTFYNGIGGFAFSNGFAGVYGESIHSGGIGVWGYNVSGGTGVLGSGSSGPGVRGNSTGGAGVLGTSVNQPGVDGTSTNSLGIRGTSTNFVGIVGISTNSHGLYGSSSSGAGGYGIVAENLGANGKGLLVTGGAPSQIFGGLQVFGTKNAVLKMQDGTYASVYCQESPEPYFEDFGRAQLVGGVANVTLEREFAQLIAGGDYMVFLTPVGGPAPGLHISRQNAGSFEVRDTSASNVSFSYRIVTKRKDIDGKRFARVSTEAAEKVAGVRAVLAGMAPAGAPSPQPSPVTPPVTPSTPPVVTNSVAPGLTVVQPGPAAP